MKEETERNEGKTKRDRREGKQIKIVRENEEGEITCLFQTLLISCKIARIIEFFFK